MKTIERMRRGLLLTGLLAPIRSWAAARWRGDLMPGRDLRFVVYYGMQDSAALDAYDVVVLDSEIDPAISRRLSALSLAVGYLSLGEVHAGRPWAAELERQGLLLSRAPMWPSARYVDQRDRRWKLRVLDEIVPAILARGFAGLFLDNLDDSSHLEGQDPVRYAGMTDATVDMIRALRARFPQICLIVNRGYSLMPRIARDIDMVLGESVHSTWDSNLGTYVRVAASDLRWQIAQLREARRLRPDLRLLSLDYWSPSDRAGIADLYAQAEANGFIPYVATFDLTRIVPRP